jgi:K319L-like, PKD domain
VTLYATQSTVDVGQTITGYQWELTKPINSETQLSGSDAVRTTFTPDTAGQYEVSLVVSDGQQDSVAATMTIQVEDIGTNSRPNAVITVIEETATVGTAFEFTGNESTDPDQDNAALTYTWLLEMPTDSNSELSFATVASISGSFTPDRVGQYTLSLTVTDTQGAESERKSVLLNASASNVPTASAVINVGTSFTVNDRITANGSNSVVPEGSAYLWEIVGYPSGTNAPAINTADPARPSFIPLAGGNYTLKLSIVDGASEVQDSVQVLINVESLDNTPIPVDDPAITYAVATFCFTSRYDATDDTRLNQGVFEISLPEEKTLIGGVDNTLICSFITTINLPDGVSLVASEATVQGSEVGEPNVRISNREGVEGAPLAINFERYNSTTGDFVLSSGRATVSDNCGGEVKLQTTTSLILDNDPNNRVTFSEGGGEPQQ